MGRELFRLLLLLLTAPVALSQCPEPSAIDLDPAAKPLLVEKDGTRDLHLSWEAVAADGFRLHRGRLDRLSTNEAYDHRVVVETAAAETTLQSGNESWFFLVNSDCGADSSNVGRDSSGNDRPWGGLLVVAVGLQGGAGVVGSQFVLWYPPAEAFTDEEGVSFVGPFARGAFGSPFGAINANNEGRINAVVAFGRIDLDPGFDPPPDMPVDISEVVFGYHGTPPPIEAFSVTDCVSSDERGNSLPEVACFVSGYAVLF